MTDVGSIGEGGLVDSLVQSPIAGVAMVDRSRCTIESRWKRLRKHRLDSTLEDGSGFLFRDDQIYRRQIWNAEDAHI